MKIPVTLDKREVFYLSILVLTFLSIYFLVFDAKMDTGGDNYEYLNYAKSIATGHGYSSPYSSQYEPVNWYPPGYSTMLGLLMTVFGTNILLFKLLNGFFLCASLVLFYFIIKKLTSNNLLAFAVNFYLIFNIGLLKFGYIIMSEIPYLFLTMLALFSLTHFDNLIKDKVWNKALIATIISVALAYYFRGIGLSLVAAVGVYFLLQKEWKSLAVYTGGIVLIHLPYMIRNMVYGLNGRYTEALLQVNPWKPESEQVYSFASFLDKLLSNFVWEILNVYPKMILPIRQLRSIGETQMLILGAMFLLVSLTGIVLIKKKYRYLFLSFYLFNLLIVLLYHSGNDFRYLIPLIPLMVFGFMNALNELLNKVKAKQQALAILIVIGGILMIPRMYEFHVMSKREHHEKFKTFIEMANFIKSLGFSNITVATRKPGILHYYSGAYVHRYKFSPNSDEVMIDLVESNVDFVFFDALGYGSNYNYLLPALREYKEHFRVIKRIDKPRGLLLQFNRMKVRKIMKKKGLL
ncbi:ArnT family glycosyltransferase [Reichenbachiella sp.]|uniref:ArnT family glycosyltransferase n=1 Tax=Reichenbachiella sp. TaxID=2184521 RepID=UPI003B5A2152